MLLYSLLANPMTSWGCGTDPIFAGGYQAEIVQNRMNDPFSPTKWIVSLTKEGLYFLNMKLKNSLQWHFNRYTIMNKC